MISHFVQDPFRHSSEWLAVKDISMALHRYLTQDDVKAEICKSNQPGASSGDVQQRILSYANQLGFVDESKGLFANYKNRHLRPDYFLRLNDETGILMEVERGKTNINNMDFLDFWKCHICTHAHYLFLLVPVELHQNPIRRPTKPYQTTVGHIESFFAPENYTNVRGAVIFGY